MAVERICEVILRDEKTILPVSSMMHGEYGIENVVLSLPAVIGKHGLETKVPISLNEEEIRKLKESAELLSEITGNLEI
jgi:L-lactate dehydrogenase